MEDGIESKKTKMYAFTERGERQIWGANSLQKKKRQMQSILNL